jgi:hypothetical protein
MRWCVGASGNSPFALAVGVAGAGNACAHEASGPLFQSAGVRADSSVWVAGAALYLECLGSGNPAVVRNPGSAATRLTGTR